MKRIFLLPLLLAGFTLIMTSATESAERRYSTSVLLLGTYSTDCTDPHDWFASLRSTDGVSAVQHTWSISGDGGYIKSTSGNMADVVPLRDYYYEREYQICVTIKGSDNNYYSDCQTRTVKPWRECP